MATTKKFKDFVMENLSRIGSFTAKTLMVVVEDVENTELLDSVVLDMFKELH